MDQLEYLPWYGTHDTNKLFDIFFTVVNDLLDTYTPCKKLSLREIKQEKTMVDERHISIY